MKRGKNGISSWINCLTRAVIKNIDVDFEISLPIEKALICSKISEINLYFINKGKKTPEMRQKVRSKKYQSCYVKKTRNLLNQL